MTTAIPSARGRSARSPSAAASSTRWWAAARITSSASIAVGRFLTGDVGRVDADGALFVEGRIDDVINRGGQKIVPAAVEAAIASMPAIRAVTAFGLPDPILGSRVAVVVELHDGADVTVDELLDHAGQRLRSFMVPELVFFADAIPRNDLGKISRHDLATIYDCGASGARVRGRG